jgi:hypothetical protein
VADVKPRVLASFERLFGVELVPQAGTPVDVSDDADWG